MNTTTPRVFIAATRQNEGKTTVSLGLIAALQPHFPLIGYIKPVGQRFVEIEEQKIDEDIVLMDAVYRLNCPLVDMSPIAVEPAFTRKYLESANNESLVKRIQGAFDRVAWEKDFVLCEGSGHAGVGSVFDLSNAQVAKTLGCKVIIVTSGGIGRPIDEVSLNQALFEKEGVEIIGVIINKVLEEKIPEITRFVGRGLKRKGLELLGVIPHEQMLCNPTVDLIREELRAELLNQPPTLETLGGRRGGGRDGRAQRHGIFQARRAAHHPRRPRGHFARRRRDHESAKRRKNGGHRADRRHPSGRQCAQGASDPAGAGAAGARRTVIRSRPKSTTSPSKRGQPTPKKFPSSATSSPKT